MLAEQKEKGERCFSNLSMTSRMWDLPPTVLNILIKVCFGNKTAKVKKKTVRNAMSCKLSMVGGCSQRLCKCK